MTGKPKRGGMQGAMREGQLVLPTFLGLGAARSGTTSLYRYLQQHPQVYLTPQKETGFFTSCGKKPEYRGPRAQLANRDTIWKDEDYRAQYEGLTDEIALGEICPEYLHVSGTAARIYERVPQAKLFAILRNPADRAFSSFALYRHEGLEPCETFAEAVADEPRRIEEHWRFCIHVAKGFYGRQIEEYFKIFDRGQIRVYLFEELVGNPAKLVRDVYRFLGVDDGFLPDLTKRYKVSGVIKNPALRFLWTRTHPLRSRVYLAPNHPLRRLASEFFGRAKMMGLEYSEETRRQLVDLYREDTLKLQELLERDLSSWLT